MMIKSDSEVETDSFSPSLVVYNSNTKLLKSEMLIGIKVQIVDARQAGKWHVPDIGKIGYILDWIEVKGFECWIPVIELEDGIKCYGSNVWWSRVEG